MAHYQSGSDAMRAYADARVAAAKQVLAAHRGDATGCCVACGRPAPCPGRTAADQLRTHYQGWLDAAARPAIPPPAAPAGDQPPTDTTGLRLIRPYVFRRGPGGRR